MLVPRLEGAPSNDVNPNSEEFLKILKQADVIKKRGSWLEVHQQIQVAVRASLSPGDSGGRCRRSAARSMATLAGDKRWGCYAGC